MRLVIAARKSDLARLQAQNVGDSLQKKNPNLQIEYHWRESLGDKNLNDPLWKMPEKGVFTEDFIKGLVAGEFDLVVHSWKDLPVEEHPQTQIAATLPREDVRDVLLFKKKDLNKKQISLMTSSPRRTYNLGRHVLDLLPNGFEKVDFEPVRGNVQTRVRKMINSEASGLIVAKAALDRLLAAEADEFLATKDFLKNSLKDLLWMVLPITLNPTAAAQGALAIEIRKDREDLKKLLAGIHCQETFDSVIQERQMLRSWGGGCHQKIGVNVLPRDYGQIVFAQGLRDNGDSIDLWRLEKTSSHAIDTTHFPQIPREATWFDRESLPLSSEHQKYNAHWISKAEALPAQIQIPADQLLWTSGIKTWYTLAKRGLWVNGSSESLGEREDMRLTHLDQTPRQWCKWTHFGGEDRGSLPLIKTYKLVPKANPPKLDPKTQHFFWMSGSSFRQALQTAPWLIDKSHWSGPGHTAEALREEIQKQRGTGSVHIALSFEQWQKTISPKRMDP